MKKLGFIGVGSMGEAILKGVLEKDPDAAAGMLVSARTAETLGRMEARYGVRGTSMNRDVAAHADILFLGVKPHQYREVIEEIRVDLGSHTVVVNMAAGISILQMEHWFGKEIQAVKIMPNTPAAVGEAMTAVSFSESFREGEKEAFMALIQSFGRALEVEEKHMDAVTGVSGSSPAYAYMFIEALADGAVKHGMKRKDAYVFAAQAVLGAAKMVLETGLHPGVLKDQVTSPGGTTIEAVAALEREGLRHAVLSAVDACVEKSKKMSESSR